MKTQIEKAFQAALLADAAYVTFQSNGYLDGEDWDNPDVHSRLSKDALNGTSTSDDVPFGKVDGGRGWTSSRFQSFADRYEVVYHQHDQDNGFSATLFYDTLEQRYVAAFRGTNEPFPDIVPADLLLALGLSSLNPEEQHSAIASFFENAGLVDASGVARPEFAGKVDFVGHSLGGYLSLWAVYEFRDLFAEVFTFNGAGISAIPGSPDYQYINALVQENPLSSAQLGRIHDYFAEEGPELTANDLTFFRPGERQGVFIERKDLLGSVVFHSVELLVESLAVYSLFSLVDRDVKAESVRDMLYAMSSRSVGSLDRAIVALSDMLGEGYAFTNSDDTEDFRQAMLVALDGAESFGSRIELLLDKDAGFLAAAAREDTEAGRGYRYALSQLLPFAVTAGAAGFSQDDPAFDTEHFTDSFLSDRALFLATLLRMNTDDLPHGDLRIHAHFTDLEQGLAFNSDAISYGGPEISDLRARLVFGSEGDDAGTLLASSQADRLYGMGGNDLLHGLDGSDYLEGGAGDDQLSGGNGGDRLLGGAGADVLGGESGDDYLDGGAGADTLSWNDGDGHDLVGDYAEPGDRIVINGIDLATLPFTRVAAGSPFYRSPSHPALALHYDGAALTVSAGSGPGAGSVTLAHYAPVVGMDYGIVLQDYAAPPATVVAVTVSALGASDLEADDQVRANAYDRQLFSQRGLDWSGIAIGFTASTVANYSAGSLHGTLGGAFEGGPVDDRLIGEDGANALHGLAGDDWIDGAAGDDFLEGGAGTDTISGGTGNDLIFGSARAGLVDLLDPDIHYDRFYLSQIGDSSGDVNVLDGGDGADHVSGGDYADDIEGGMGLDYVLGGTGDDFISAGADRDIIYGDSALHYRYVELSPGVATEKLEIVFADGSDAVGQYDDVIHGGSGDDTLWGELGDDELHGDEGDDTLVGDRFNDAAYFSAELPAYRETSPELVATLHGNDRLYGGAGADLLLGLAGDDLLAGGGDNDHLLGGAGDDIYVFEAGDGLDHIEDAEGSHTLLFGGIAAADLQVLFQGEQVVVGTGQGLDGFYLSRSEWANTRIALDSPDAVIERSRLDTFYLDRAGNLLLTVKASADLAEADRDALFTVDTSDPDKPRIVVAPGVNSVELEATEGGSGGATMRIVSGGMQFILELAAMQLATGLDFLSLANGVPLSLSGLSGSIVGSSGADRIIGSESADVIHGGGGNDVLEGRGGSDDLDGGTGDDVLRGGEGNDSLYGGQMNSRDWLDGGRGSDTLDGGYGPDTYVFAPGDGLDKVSDPEGYNYLEFDAGVDPAAVALYYTSTTASRFQVEYGPGDSFSSAGTFSSYWINGVTAGGTAIPLVQRSDLADGTFRDTRWHDVFEPGPGSDTILVNGWGNDAFRFAAGDGQDVIAVDNNYYPELMGEIRLREGVDPESVSFSFLNGDAVITYGTGDQLTLDTDTVFSGWDNTLGRFTLVSEADPAWIPVIRAQGYGGLLHGSYGADHIIGGPNVETILPGSGDDIIEAGGSPDRIVLNDVYMDQGNRGIGRKHIWGQGDNDIIETPLHQGLTFHLDRGDGDDRIEYDWSYSWQHPYRFSYEELTNSLSFLPYGDDTLAFGGDITLADLRFIRTGATLIVALRDGGGSVTVADFFHAWDVETTPGGDDPSPPIPEEGELPDTLLDPAFLPLLPRTPIAALSFADGSRYDMAAVLDSFLEVSDATLLGTEGDDELYGTQGDDIIHALGGNDYIEDFGGSNVVLAGAGDDQLLLGSDATIDPGAGNDWVLMVAGNHVISFGPGGGSDLVMLDVALGTVVVELAAGVSEADIVVTLVAMEWGQVPMITLPGSGDALVLASLRYNPELDTWSADADSVAATLRFADGSVITGRELYTMAAGGGGNTIEGTSGDDVLVGTEGNDTLIGGGGDDIMDGAGGDDLFLVEGRRQGGDRITGGPGFDTIGGGAGDDRIALTELLVSDSIERIDGGLGVNTIAGSGGANILDFSGTELRAIAAVDGRGGQDQITGSAGDDVLIGGAGRDTLSGGRGNDTYVFTAGDGRDIIDNADADPAGLDILQLADLDYHQIWLSRRRDHLVLNIAGSTDRVLIKDWYLNEASQLDAIYAGGHVLLRDQVDQLVSAMATFDVPEGVDAIIPGQTALELAPVLSAVWQLAA